MPTFNDARLNHLLKVLLQENDEEGPFHQMLDDYGGAGYGITSIYDVLDIEFSELMTLKWKPPGRTQKVQVLKGIAMKLVAAIKYIAYMNQETNNGVMMDEADFQQTLTDADFTFWRYDQRHKNAKLPAPPPPGSSTTTMTTMHTTDPVDAFKKGIKRDKTLFPKLRSEQFFESWLVDFTAEGNAQGMEKIFDESYNPTDAKEVEVFKLQKTYMYAVFTSTLLTDKGKEIVRDHSTDSDAQAIWKKLVAHMKTSTAANIAKEELATFFATSKLDSRWKGTAGGYIAHWREKMRVWENMTPTTEHYTDIVKKRMVITAVQGNGALKHVQQLEEQRTTAGDSPFTFTQFMNLLESTATRHDHETGVATGRSRRVVNLHDTHEIHSYLDNGDSYWDTSVTQDPTDDFNDVVSYAAYETISRAQNRPFFPRHIWEKIPSDVRKDILTHDWSSSESKKKSGLSDSTKARVAAQLHQVEQPHLDDHRDVQKLIANVVQETVSSMMQHAAGEHVTNTTNDVPTPSAGVNETQANPLMALLSNQSSNLGDIRRVLATSAAAAKMSKESKSDEIEVDGRKYRACTHKVRYNVSKSQSEHVEEQENSSRIDRCSNGFYTGSDMKLMATCVPPRFADVQGIDSYTTSDVPIGTVAGVVTTMTGPVVVIIHQSAHSGKGKSIWSVPQMEAFGAKVDDRSIRAGGKQRIITQEGYVIPISIRQGLPSVDVRPPTEHEMENLPHVVLTSDAPWDPTIMDKEADPAKMDPVPDLDAYLAESPFDVRGNYRYREVNEHFVSNPGKFTDEFSFEDYVDKCLSDIRYGVYDHSVKVKDDTDYKTLRPYFLWAPDDVIKDTIKNTTQWGRTTPDTYPFKMHYKSPFPAGNVPRRPEPVATDYVYSDTPAIDDGSTGAQIYVGLKSEVVDVYGCKSDAQFVDTLEDSIRKRGAMEKLISDRAKAQISNRVHDILRSYIIGDWQSDPYHEHQNPAERKYQDVKGKTNQVLDFTGAPAYTWLLAMTYVCYILNLLASNSLGGIPPLTALTGQTQDISHLFLFSFWDEVLVPTKEKLAYNKKPGFPSETAEEKGRMVGFGDGVGTNFTFKILLDKTQKIVYRRDVRPALSDEQRNLRVFPTQGESEIREVVKSPVRMPLTEFHLNGTTLERNAKFLDPDDLINRTFLTAPDERGQRFRAKIVQKVVQEIDEHGNKLRAHPDFVKFLVRCEGDRADEIITYNEAMEHVNEELKKTDDPNAILWTFEEIIAHEGPLKPGDPTYKGSSYNLLVAWSDGSRTYEPLSLFAVDDPVTCARYAQRAGLLDMPGWKRFQRLAKRDKKMLRMENQAKLRSKRSAPIYKYGFRVPRTAKEALEIDKTQNNTRWKESMALEISQLQEYDTFRDLGKGTLTPAGYKRIQVHMVFDIKHDGRHKSRMVAGGHMTDAPVESVYSGVVSLRSLRMVIFLAELNGLELWGADIGNAYLEAKTKEKVYIVGGLEFGEELQGHTLIIDKALYGLKSSGLRWHEKLFDTLRELGFEVSKADNDVWMRRSEDGECYEYIAVYVDDLCLAMKDPQSFIEKLKETYGFKLKGVGPLEHHLGTSYGRDSDGTLYASSQRYIEKMVDSYGTLFPGEKLNTKLKSALPKNDHPELDDSPLLNEVDTAKYLSMIGALHWVVSLGRFDVHTATVSLAKFRVAPRQGHLERAKGVYGYLAGNKDGAIRFRTGEPDYTDLPDQEFDWMRTVYGHVEELKAKDAPPPLGKRVIITTYVDANLYHDLITGRALTGILHMLNGTPIDWYSKRQATVETATYGSEFVAARIATDQIIDLRITLRYLGVPVEGSSIMFGDNKSVVTSSTIPHSALNKRHNALSYHRVREAIAAKILKFFHMDGKMNPADILSKHTGYADAWPLIQPLLFWRGQPAIINNKKTDTAVQVIGECQDLKRTEPNGTVRANKARRSLMPFSV